MWWGWTLETTDEKPVCSVFTADSDLGEKAAERLGACAGAENEEIPGAAESPDSAMDSGILGPVHATVLHP